MDDPTLPSDRNMASTLTSSSPAQTRDAKAGFLSIPRELRDEIYELVLLQDEPITPCTRLPRYTLGLLKSCRLIHDEASQIFYGKNRWDLTTTSTDEAAVFFKQMGANTRHLRDIIIAFPWFVKLDAGEAALHDSSLSILAEIRINCVNLTQLTTEVWTTAEGECQLDSYDNHNVCDEALRLVDNYFRAISTLRTIVVQVFEFGPSDYIRRTMETLGWTLETTAFEEEDDDQDRDFSDYEYERDFGDWGYDYDEDEDDYDIDNDSDFWRRAAD